MSIGRTFWKLTRYARAARFWLLLALAALAWLGLGGEARAQAVGSCPGYGAGCSVETAYQACKAWADAGPYSGDRTVLHPCTMNSNDGGVSGFWRARYCYNETTSSCTNHQAYFGSGCPSGTVWNGLPGQNRCMSRCSMRASSTFTPQHGAIVPNGSVGCSDGCQFFSHSNGDGTYSRNWINDDAVNHCSVMPNECTLNGAGYYLHPGLGMCVPPMSECAANEVRDPLTGECGAGCPPGMTQDALGACVVERDTCPAGQIRAPSGQCLPGEGQCAAGEARKPDGTCGRDSDNDGTPDEFDPDTDSTSFSGGDTCNAPPSCSGDPIMCGQARIQWRIECNTRDDAKVSGGNCGAVPACSGTNCKALEYAQLLQQWRTSCALEKLAGASGGGDAGQPGWTKVDGMNQDPSQGSGAGDEPALGSFDIDGEGIEQGSIVGGGGSCPALGASGTGALVDNLVAMVNNPGGAWCQYIAGVYSILILFGMASAIFIMAKGY